MYTQNTRSVGHGSYQSSVGYRTTGQKGKRAQEKKEFVPLVQLLVCVVLFLTVFVGKGVFPGKLEQVRENVLEVIGSDTDFRAAFADLGASLAEKNPVFEDLGQFCVEVFGTNEAELASVPLPDLTAQMNQELNFLNSKADYATLAAHYLRLEDMPAAWLPTLEAPVTEALIPEEPAPVEPAEPVVEVLPVEPAVPAVGTVVMAANYTGMALPNNYTMDEISFGTLETVTPVLGRLRSEYGYRDHPVDGEYKFHNGLDIGGQTGDPIGAFAAGTVEYIGENDVHGLYLQIDHGNGIKSFYAHCSKLCASKGHSVAAGETIAEVGATGVSTGPHLHFELKYDGTHLNPIYYVNYLSE